MELTRARWQWLATVAMGVALGASPAYVIRFHVGPLPSTLLEVLLVIAIGVGLYAFWEELPWSNPYTLPTLVFLAAATISVFVSPERREALGTWKAYFVEPMAAALVIAAIAQVRDRARLILAGLAVAGTVAALLNLAVVLEAEISGRFRVVHPPVAIYNTPNAVPLYLVPLIAFALPIAALTRERRDRMAATAFTLVAALAVLLSYSRAGWLALIAVIIFVALFTPLRNRLVIAVTALVVLALLLVPGVRRRIAIDLDPTNPNNSLGLRLALWKSALNMLRHRPLFGAGLDGFKTSVVPYRDPSFHEQQIYPHDIVLNFWSETGLLGLLAFVWLCVTLVRTALAGLGQDPWARALSVGLLALLVAFIVHGAVDVPYFKNDQALAFWALLGVQLGAIRARPRPAPTTSRPPSLAR